VVKAPLHPYTKGLMGSIPKLDAEAARLVQIPGSMPRLTAIPAGCAFHPRCPRAFAPCRRVRPERIAQAQSEVACWLYEPQAVPFETVP
jgi:peptide/nickel transport system ATP-binding protein